MAPSTVEPATSSPLFRRSVTLPLRSANDQIPQSYRRNVDSNTIEPLFAHPSCRLIKFSPSQNYTKQRSNSYARADQQDEPIGILPWASRAERTLAASPMSVLQTVNDNVASLSFNSGRTVHPIMPKSQCWCVDGETKFVLKVRENEYYRIELPNTCSEDQRNADKLKEVLSKILQYERTACPFKRGFTVELPESPKTPTKYRPWTPRPRPLAEISSLAYDEVTEPAAAVRGDSSEENMDNEQEEEVIEDATSGTADSEDLDDAFDTLKTPTRPKGLNGARSVTAPPQWIPKSIPPSNTMDLLSRTTSHDSETASIASSVDSFHSFHSFHSPISPLPPSPPYSDPPSPPQRVDFDLGIDVSRSRQHKRDDSELTVTAESFEVFEDSSIPTWPQVDGPSTPIGSETPTLTNDVASTGDELWPEVVTPSPRTALRRRRRALSPLPPPANLYSPQARLSGHYLTTVILHKTCALLLGPPLQLVALMLNIAQRIARGALYTSSATFGEQGQVIPGTWDQSQSGTDSEDNEVWAEDDYGISLREFSSRKSRLRGADGSNERDVGESWEID